jgi:hypothetical protein
MGEVDRVEGLLLMEATIQMFKVVNRFCKKVPENLYNEAENIRENILVKVYREEDGKYLTEGTGEKTLRTGTRRRKRNLKMRLVHKRK